MTATRQEEGTNERSAAAAAAAARLYLRLGRGVCCAAAAARRRRGLPRASPGADRLRARRPRWARCATYAPVVAAAIETCRTVQYDINFPLLSQKYGIRAVVAPRDVAERLKRLGLLECRPEALRTPPKEYSSSYLRSLQLRVHYSSTQPNLDNIAVASTSSRTRLWT